MITSGPKSYYEEYVRRKDTERAFAKPPALLTDRNAYINFLEVQLERVSSACFSVQAYEQRFNDMQGLIVSLEERCSSTARLVQLAQQCTEEVRAEAHQRAELGAQTNKNMRNELQKSLKDITANVSRLEGAVHAIPQLEARLNATDKRMTDIDNRQLDIEVTSKTTQVDMNNRMGRLESVKDELFALIESTRASISRVTFDVEENNTRVNSYINGIETRLTESVDSLRDDLTREVNAVHAKAANQADELRRLVEAKNAEMVASTRQQYKALSEELDSTRRRWATNYDALSAHVKEDTDRKVGRLQQTLTQTVGDLRASHNKQAGFMCDLEESFASQLEALQTQLRDLSTTHRTHAQTVTDTHKVLEGRIQELTTTMHAPVYPQQPGYAWVGPPGTPAGMAASFRVPEDFSMGGPQGPPSPISHAQDRSFLRPQEAHNMANTSVRHYSHTPVAVQSSSFHESAFRQPALSGNTSVVTAKSAASRRATSSPGRGGTSPSASRGNPETDRKRRETKKAGAVDIVQKFLEIYENDQKDITQRLERLGAAKPSRSNSANRRRLRKATAAVKRQEIEAAAEEEAERAASPPRQEVKKKDKSPGEVLSRFFLNYKKDRKALIERMSTVEKVARKRSSLFVPEGGSVSQAAEDTPGDDEDEDSGADTPIWEERTRDGPSRGSPARAGMGAHAEPSHADSPAPSDPAQEVVETMLSRSMDEFMRSFRSTGSASSSRQRGTAPARQEDAGSVASSATSGSRDLSQSRSYSQRSTSKSPNRPLRSSMSSSLLGADSARDCSGRSSRGYMLPTESLSIARSQSPVDRSAVEWLYDHVSLKPVWKVNTYRSPDRSRPSSRANSTSPGARTAATLIDRLARQDRSVLFSKVRGASKCAPSEPAATPGAIEVPPVYPPAPPVRSTGDVESVVSSSSTASSVRSINPAAV